VDCTSTHSISHLIQPNAMASVAYDVFHKVAPVLAESFAFQNASTTQNELYGDINMDHLNWLEKKWAGYYIWMGNALLATGVMSFVMHEVSLKDRVQKIAC
jgi:methylsterol monooxygenase